MKFRPQVQLRFRDEEQYERIKVKAVADEISLNEYVLRVLEAATVDGYRGPIKVIDGIHVPDCKELVVTGEVVGVEPTGSIRERRRGKARVSDIVRAAEMTEDEKAKAERKKRKQERHAELKQDAMTAVAVGGIPEKFIEKMNTPSEDHYPTCKCLRCQLKRGEIKS